MIEYNIALVIALLVSVSFIVSLVWYNRQITNRLLFVSENLNDLTTMIELYRGHLKALYATEMYYGDDTIKNLIAHTNSLSELLEEYEDVVYLTEPMELNLNKEEKEIEKDETFEETPKDVFYGGTRTSDN